MIAVHNDLSDMYLCLQRKRTCFRTSYPRWLSSSAGNTSVVYVMLWLKPALPHPHTYLILIPDTGAFQTLQSSDNTCCNPWRQVKSDNNKFFHLCHLFWRPYSSLVLSLWPYEPCVIHVFNHLFSSHRAFRINELKTEVTNRLAMLEKRVECMKYILCHLSKRITSGKKIF